MSDERSGEDRSDSEDIASLYSTAELRQLCLDVGLRVDRSWDKEALISLLLGHLKNMEPENSFDAHREKIMAYVNSHRTQLKGVLHCPLLDDERGCYQCSDTMVTVCMHTNEKKLGGD